MDGLVTITCPSCFGDGRLMILRRDKITAVTTSPPYQDVICEVCNGDGEVEIEIGLDYVFIPDEDGHIREYSEEDALDALENLNRDNMISKREYDLALNILSGGL